MNKSLLGCTSVESQIESDGSSGAYAAVRTRILNHWQILIEGLYMVCLLKTLQEQPCNR